MKSVDRRKTGDTWEKLSHGKISEKSDEESAVCGDNGR